MYTIGQFSFITRLSVRTLRRYHENKLLLPDYIDEDSGYRYYKTIAIERAKIITTLREMDFPIKEILTILENCQDDEDMLDHLLQKKQAIESQLSHIQNIKAGLDTTIENVKRIQQLSSTTEITKKTVHAFLFAGIRNKAKWQNIGSLFGQVARKVGRNIAGSAMSLCYDNEYKDENADYEGGFPLKKQISKEGLNCRELPSIQCISLIHKGSYTEIGNSYKQIFEFIIENKYTAETPSREIYLKGPGMILRGNPKKYITEIQIPVISN